MSQANIAKMRKLFPECITEVLDQKTGRPRLAVNFDLLRQELSDAIVEGAQERYQLDWPGKQQSLVTANAPSVKTLRPAKTKSKDFDSTKNLFIEGDNLDALKLLQKSYLGRIKMIYVDPPYNTGNDFVYTDDYAENYDEYLKKSNQVSNAGERLVSNPEGHGRFHSNWLTMIMPRLRLAKNLLTRDGAIFVSCDEGEHPRLRLLMDEIFGESNFIADMVWAAGRKNNSRFVSVSHEYIVCYVRDVEYLREKQIIWRQKKRGLDEIYAQYNRLKRRYRSNYKAMTEGIRKWYQSLREGHPSLDHRHYSNVDARGIYFASDISCPGGGGGAI